MRTVFYALILLAALALNSAVAFGASTDRTFFGDGFDNTTCADLPHGEKCR